MIIPLICFVLWYAIGTIPIVLMSMRRDDIELGYLIFILITGIFGPFSLLGYIMAYGIPGGKVIIKHRP